MNRILCNRFVSYLYKQSQFNNTALGSGKMFPGAVLPHSDGVRNMTLSFGNKHDYK